MRRFFLLLCLLLVGLSPVYADEKKADDPALNAQQEQKLRDLEEKVGTLENKIASLEEKTKIVSEKIFRKRFSENQPVLRLLHNNQLGGTFKIEEMTYTLNGQVIFTADKAKLEAIREKKEIYRQSLQEGLQTIQVMYKARGHGFGVFTYMSKYLLEVRKQTQLRTYKGRISTLEVQMIDKGGNLQTRLDLKFDVVFQDQDGKPVQP